MSSFPSPTAELAEGKANITSEITPMEGDRARKERSMPQPSLEPSLNHLKPTTNTTSEEDASDNKSADQTAAKTGTETLEKSSQSEKVEAGSNAVAATGSVDTTTANHTDAQLDLDLKDKTESIREKTSDEDSQVTDNSEDESDEESIVYTAEGQKFRRNEAKKHITQFEPYFKSVEYRMNYLEQELKKLRGTESKPRAKRQEALDETGAASSEPVPSIQRMNWADFKPSKHPQEAQELSQRFTWDRLKVQSNLQEELDSMAAKVSGDQQHGTPGAKNNHQHHVLEVLIEDPGASKRRRARKYTDDGNFAKGSSQKAKAYQQGDNTNSQTSLGLGTPILQCPERVRICSPALLEILRGLFDRENTYDWTMPHMVFLRPFKFLVLYEAEIRAALKNLEKRWQTMGQTKPIEQTSERNNEGQKNEASKSNDPDSQNYDKTTAEESSDPVVRTDTYEALEHLRLLVEFMDNDLKSTFALRRQINSKKDCPIAFSDLWHLYEHGQEVRTPGDQIQVFKVARFTGGRDLLCESVPRISPEVPSSCIERQESKGAFFVECYSYDFNGTQYGPVQTMFEIRRYEGLRDITSLQVYPLWFDPDHQNKRIQMLRRGDKFIALARVNRTAHKSYRGTTLDEHAEEVSWSDSFRYDNTKLVQIESPIVVDFQLAISKGKVRAPSIGFQSKLDCDLREVQEVQRSCGFETCHSFDDIHRDLIWFDIPLSEEFLTNQKPHLAPVEDPEELGEDERILLPYSLHGFVLRNKKWRTFNIDKVEDIKYSSGFDDLVLPRGHKDTVEALVKRHSEVGSGAEAKMSMDLVSGKGKGLIILLHGAPGVGKTSTAECVAEKTDRPLFAITCGDLGESAIEVEESLEKNFSLAHRWGCLLLLDEADVFLSLRSQTNLRRNAVVSVFLRTLEYYSGILFLTTNRVGTLDPAFKSRIHVSLYYPNLTKKASSEIWRNHIQKAKDYFENKGTKYSLRKREIIEFSKQHFKDLSGQGSGPWNGRQIRNAFQTAIALSEHEARLNGGNTELTERHFEKVAKASSEFDKYLRLTHGRSESQMAEASKIRTDNPDKAAKMKAAIASRQLPGGHTNSKDESSDSDSDSSESYSSDSSKTSSSEEMPPAKVSKKTEKKQKARSKDEALSTKKVKKERARQESSSEEEATIKKKSKKEKAKHQSASEEESPPTTKTKKGKAKQKTTSDEDSPPTTKKSKKDKEGRKKQKEASSDEDEQESGEEEKEMKKAAKETKGKEKEKEKEKAKSTSKTFN